jgi:hypothetical protein
MSLTRIETMFPRKNNYLHNKLGVYYRGALLGKFYNEKEIKLWINELKRMNFELVYEIKPFNKYEKVNTKVVKSLCDEWQILKNKNREKNTK